MGNCRIGSSKIETGSGVGRPEAEAEAELTRGFSVECWGNGPRIVHVRPLGLVVVAFVFFLFFPQFLLYYLV
jgi:hypothetical protein